MFWKNFGQIILALIALLVLYLIYSIVSSNVKLNKMRAYVRQHPEAVKVYLSPEARGATSGIVRLLKVNGGTPTRFYDARLNGFLVTPGSSGVEAQYSLNRSSTQLAATAGIPEFNETVTVEEGKSYRLSYDPEASKYVFEEFTAPERVPPSEKRKRRDTGE